MEVSAASRPLNTTSLDPCPEQTIDPGVEIVDAHHHLWVKQGSRYLAEEFSTDLDCGHNVRATVFVEGGTMYRPDGPVGTRFAGEVDFAAQIAEISAQRHGATKLCSAIVGRADLTETNTLESLLDEMAEIGQGRFRGVRHMIAHDPEVMQCAPAGLIGTRDFRTGFEMLEKRGLTFDAFVHHHQIPELVELARSFSMTRIVVNHVGGRIGIGSYAAHQDRVFSEWRSHLKRLASCENVFIKIGGMGMPLAGFFDAGEVSRRSSCDWALLWRPSFEVCLETFGASRCMFESNFPVDKQAISYQVLWNVFKRLASSCSPTEAARIFSETAANFYGISTTSK